MSKVIKPGSYIALEDLKKIEAVLLQAALNHPARNQEPSPEINEALGMKEQILRDAEAMAEQQLRQAAEEAESLRRQTAEEIEGWWRERRSQDEQTIAAAGRQGYDEGYRQGFADVEAEVRRQHAEMLREAQTVLEEAHRMKQRIIQEAEPFLVELSAAMAEKVMNKQLTISPEWVKDMAKDVLARRREKGLITLCVAPQHFLYFRDAREELLLAIDSQAELQILPDATVADYGCVVRSEFGSIDARIDTQLKEIKSALQQLAVKEEPTV